MTAIEMSGCTGRRREDGGIDFVLDSSDLNWIRVDHQTRLQFGETEIVIETPFTLTVGGATHELDPEDRHSLGPLLACYPARATSVAMTPDGTLDVAFESGAHVRVPSHPKYEAWSVDMFWCVPGGFRAADD